MSQVVQARCPYCQNVLRIPEEWLAKAMRCKHCKKTFQAKGASAAPSSANVPIGMPAKAPAPIPVAKPAYPAPSTVPTAKPAYSAPITIPTAKPAYPAPITIPTAKPAYPGPIAIPTAKHVYSAPMAVPAATLELPPPSAMPIANAAMAGAGQSFGFEPEHTPAEPMVATATHRRKRSNGSFLFLVMFFFLFLAGVAGAAYVLLGNSGAGFDVFNAFNTAAPDGKKKPIAKRDGRSDGSLSMFAKNYDKSAIDPFADKSGIIKNKDGDTKPTDGMPPSDGPPKKKDAPRTDKKIFPPPPPPKKDLGKDLVKKDSMPKKDGLPKKDPFGGNEPFPRRALLISVNNYFLYNTVHYGSAPIKGVFSGSSTGALREKLTQTPNYFPASQVTELSDGALANSHPTQKSVIEAAITDFVETSRAQDRIILFYTGHAASIEDKSYLVPVDGNITNPESLLPLKWVYDQLAKCKAQQKILILDMFRFSPSRGFELPGTGEGDEGTLPEGFDKDVLNPPTGVQVWCACQKEQSSIELDGGSAFMQALCHSLQGGADNTKGIAKQADPLDIEDLVKRVNGRLETLVGATKRTQVSRLSGKGMDGNLPFDAQEPKPVAIKLKDATFGGGGGAAKADAINKILEGVKEIPAVRETTATDPNRLSAQKLPAFSAKTIVAYNDDKSLGQMRKLYTDNKEGFAKEFPLRAAYFEAVSALQESQKLRPREVLNSPINPKQKAAFLFEQEPLGLSIFKLEQVLDDVKKAAAEQRDNETSKLWQAHFDYAQARLQSRLIYLFEYNFTLGQIRADNLPELGAGQNGWRIGVKGLKINVTENKAKALAKETKVLWGKIEQRYPETPWALLAQRESKIALSLEWRPKSD